jgi:hypothetical protein
MSEHIQPAPDPHHPMHSPTGDVEPERTPGVLHEKSEFSMRLVLWVGFGLIVVAVVLHFVVAGLLAYDERRNLPPSGSESSLALEDAGRPLGQRLLDVPAPHLEGIERETSLLVLRVGAHEDRRFFAGPSVRVHIGDNPNARLFELREGQEVTITYHMPGGADGGFGVVTSVISPPGVSRKNDEHALPLETQILTATVLRIDPRGVAAAREWAEVQMNRYGWADRQKGVAHIPVAEAMEQVLRSKEFQPPKKKGGSSVPPTRSNSGRGKEEMK